jgi:hypothetical protein
LKQLDADGLKRRNTSSTVSVVSSGSLQRSRKRPNGVFAFALIMSSPIAFAGGLPIA